MAEQRPRPVSRADSHLTDRVLLPSQRKLAEALGVSRSTVTEAYEALVAADVVEFFQSSGCRVRRKGFAAIGADSSVATVLGPDSLASYDIARGALPGLPIVAEAIAGLDRRRLMGHVAAGGFLPPGCRRFATRLLGITRHWAWRRRGRTSSSRAACSRLRGLSRSC
ncbi:GntR family transcriptional regulator [Amycolatopsis sp. NPDC023774]|uniref:GntR family transcriptional regulator n=1 Tax=Amycolatopsis sp. NPDC023774 TaxID=3155015 RepID=UPI0033C73BEA